MTVLLQVFRNKEHGYQAAGSSGKFAWPFASSLLHLPSLILPFFSPPAVVSNLCRCLQDHGNSDHCTGICPSGLKVRALFSDITLSDARTLQRLRCVRNLPEFIEFERDGAANAASVDHSVTHLSRFPA